MYYSLVRDARYLNQQLSGLKNVNVSTGLLETFINEKAVPGLPIAENATLAPPVAISIPASPQPQKQLLRFSISNFNEVLEEKWFSSDIPKHIQGVQVEQDITMDLTFGDVEITVLCPCDVIVNFTINEIYIYRKSYVDLFY